MTTRTGTETVTFQHPFGLSGTDAVQSAGIPPARRIATLSQEQKRGAGVIPSWDDWWAFNATDVKLTILVAGGVALTGLLT